MNKVVIRTVLVCFAIPLVLFCVSFIRQPGYNDFVSGLGLAFSVAGLLYIIPGIILAIIKQSRSVGQGILLSVALLLLIGFTFCSIHPPRFN
jgi:ABC-type transport system involved in multi-copper enzyme maturation permease subunit